MVLISLPKATGDRNLFKSSTNYLLRHLPNTNGWSLSFRKTENFIGEISVA